MNLSEIARQKCPDGFWPKDVSENERGARILDFERAIYPVWASIETKDREADANMTREQLAATTVLLECQTLHRQDEAIIASGKSVNRGGVSRAVSADLQRVRSRGSWADNI